MDDIKICPAHAKKRARGSLQNIIYNYHGTISGVRTKRCFLGFFEQLRKALGKFTAFGDNAYTFGGKAVTEQQNSKALRQCAAPLLRNHTAYFSLGTAGKRKTHGLPPF